MVIAHVSDPHFGQIAHDGAIVDALVEAVNREDVDLVAVSGDLTQRALPHEFEAARAMLDAIDPPVIVVPGNHDVYPWWNPIRRLAQPLRRYREFVTDDLTPTFTENGVAALGINTAYGRTITEGRITDRMLETMGDFFGAQPEGTFRVLVLHHHLTKVRVGYHGIARRADDALTAAAAARVDLLLCGHLHISHIEPVEIVPGEHRVVVASAGTATSTRGRKWHRDTNFYNRITVGSDTFTVEERRYVPEMQRFVRDSTTHFDRHAHPA